MAAIGHPVTVIQPLDAKDVPMSLVEKKFTQQNPQTGIRHIPAQLAQFTLDWMNRTNPGWLTTVKEKNPELAKKYEIAQSSTGNQNLVQAASGNPKPIGKIIC